MQSILLTGINAGIGRALAVQLLSEGYRVIGTTRSGAIDGLEHPNLILLALELTDESSVDRAFQYLKSEVGNIDILINNAGVGPDLDASLPERNSFKATFESNVTGLVFFTETLLELIRSGGQIINVSSQMGLMSRARSNAPAYRMSKAAVNMYSKILSQRLESRNIRVLAIHPGWVQTRLGGPGASMTVQQSAKGISALLKQEEPKAGFWNVETGEEMAW